MADVRNVIETIWRGRDEVTAQMRTIQGQANSMFSTFSQGQRQTSLLNNQMRALGTTLRYAFAGITVYGMVNLIRQWGEFQNQLGQISSLTGGNQGPALVGRNLQNLGNQLIQVSNDTAQPIADLQEGVVELFSTVDNVPENAAAKFMEDVGKAANTSQASIKETTTSLLGMLTAFGLNIDKAPQVANLFRSIIAESQAMPGTIFSQQSGRLFQQGRMAGLSLPEISGLAVAATRFGGSQPANQLALAQFFSSITTPTPQHEKALAQIGLGAARRDQLGGMGTIQAYLDYITRVGGVTTDPDKIRNADDEGTGLISGPAARVIQKTLGRLQSQRIVSVLTALNHQGTGENKSLQQYIEDMADAYDNAARSAKQLDDANQRALNPATYRVATNEIHNMGIALANAYGFILNPVFGALGGGAKSASKHAGATAAVLGGTLGAFGLWRLAKGRGLFGGIGRAGALGLGLKSEFSENAPDGRPTNPFYVIVIGGGSGIPGLGRKGAAASKGAEEALGDTKVATKENFITKLVKRFPLAPVVGGGTLAATLAASPLAAAYLMHGGKGPGFDPATHPNLNRLYTTNMFGVNKSISDPRYRAYMDWQSKRISADQAEARLAKLSGAIQKPVSPEAVKHLQQMWNQILPWGGGGKHEVQVTGKLAVPIVVENKAPDGTVTSRKRYHVTADIIPDFQSNQPDTWRGTRPTPRSR